MQIMKTQMISCCRMQYLIRVCIVCKNRHFIRVCTVCLYKINIQRITCGPSIFTMDNSNLNVSLTSFLEKSTGLHKVNQNIGCYSTREQAFKGRNSKLIKQSIKCVQVDQNETISDSYMQNVPFVTHSRLYWFLFYFTPFLNPKSATYIYN